MNFEFPTIKVKDPETPSTSPLDERIEVFVLTNKSKPSVTMMTLRHLGIPFQVHMNPDWEIPEDHPELTTDRSARPMIRGYAIRQYRAFKGHQEIMRLAKPHLFTLVFEDDASLMADTTPAEVIQQLNMAPTFLDEYEAVSFHARNQSPPINIIKRISREYVELGIIEQKGWGHQFFLKPVTQAYDGRYADYRFRWHEGCLAYMVNQQARMKWLLAGHGHGMPCDLFLANELKTIVMRDTIFFHDQRHGSLISNTVKS